MPAAIPDLSIIIPIAPGETAWRGLVGQIPPDWSVVISAAEPRPAGLPEAIDWCQGPSGRGRQLNAGARRGSSRWLWFVHADSLLEPAAIPRLSAWLEQSHEALGYLDLGFQADGPGLARLNAWGANLRSWLFGLPYGDQGLCLTRSWFDRLGGFREDLERGEDLDLVVRARRAGLKTRRIPARILSSARRYRDQGWLKTSWQHQVKAWQLIRQARQSDPQRRAP